MPLEFGSFNGICQQVGLSLCPYMGTDEGITPKCYARNAEVSGTLIFQISSCIIQVIALVMTTVMIVNIKSKYTAVGRKEIVLFFYLYMLATILEMLLVTNLIPTASVVYPYFAAAHIGIVTATCWCLMTNGFVGFQFAEDGTPLSLWSIRISSLVVFGVGYFVAIATFNGWLFFNRASPTPLWILFLIFNGAAVLVYVVLQIVLVVNTLDDRWPLGDVLFGALFFMLAQIFLFTVSTQICEFTNHYIDGLFFGTICNLLAVMMVYKYWDSITKEDLEFSIGSGGQNLWEVKELLNDVDDYSATMGMYSSFNMNTSTGSLPGFNAQRHSFFQHSPQPSSAPLPPTHGSAAAYPHYAQRYHGAVP